MIVSRGAQFSSGKIKVTPQVLFYSLVYSLCLSICLWVACRRELGMDSHQMQSLAPELGHVLGPMVRGKVVWETMKAHGTSIIWLSLAEGKPVIR